MDRRSFGLGVVLIAAAIALPSGVSAQAPPGAVSASEMLAALNSYRRANGLPPIRLDQAVANAARSHASAMAAANSLSHDLGGDLRSRLARFGIGRTASVENVAWGVNTVPQAMALWQGSSLHNQNLLAPDASRMGLGTAAGPTGLYWALIIVGPAGGR